MYEALRGVAEFGAVADFRHLKYADMYRVYRSLLDSSDGMWGQPAKRAWQRYTRPERYRALILRGEEVVADMSRHLMHNQA